MVAVAASTDDESNLAAGGDRRLPPLAQPLPRLAEQCSSTPKCIALGIDVEALAQQQRLRVPPNIAVWVHLLLEQGIEGSLAVLLNVGPDSTDRDEL